MLNKLRGFSSTKLAAVLVAIIIIPFVFWGMGSVFSGGNTNNVAKINNESVSTQDFIDHINQSRFNTDIIRENIDKNILEEILSDLVSNKLLDMEINDLNVFISEKTLVNKIKSNESFLDDNSKFSRIKYEKFLLENNLTAPIFESRLKKQELKKNLFDYISGGIKSPYFLNNKIYVNETKKIEIDYFDLNNAYDTEIKMSDVDKFIAENEENLKEEYIDFLYAKITPKDLVEIDEFNENFFKKLDEIENSILNGSNINEIKKSYNFNLISKKNYKVDNEAEDVLKEIYSKRNGERIQLIDKNDYFLLFEINKINKILPNKSDPDFIKLVKDNIIIKNKYDLHQKLFKKIQEKEMDDNEFKKISKNIVNIKNTTINGIKDYEKFDNNSVKLIYSLPKDSYILITSEQNKIYLAKIKNIFSTKLDRDDKKVKEYSIKSNINIINDIYSSYDLSLNSKYKVKIFNTTLDRVKNYFR